MLIYEGTKEQFLEDDYNGMLVDKIQDNLYKKMHRHSGAPEVRSWKNSLPQMCLVLNDPDIPDDSGIAIEYNIPRTSMRVDFMISGYDQNDVGNIVIIELKQWDKLTAVQGTDGLVSTYTGGAEREVPHPSYQVSAYAMMISDYNEEVQERHIQLSPCAYLHNYERKPNDPLDEKQYDFYLKEAPAFTYGQVLALKNFIKERVVKGMANVIAMFDADGASYAETVLNAKDSDEAIDAAITALLDDGCRANFVSWERGSVLPKNAEDAMGSEHMYSFDHAYKISAVRDWLFEQKK